MKTKFVRATIFVAILIFMPILLVGSSSGNIDNRVITGIPLIDNYICGIGASAQHNSIPIDFGTATHIAVQSGNWSELMESFNLPPMSIPNYGQIRW